MDYRQTVNLPQTEFAQRASLAAREPERFARWAADALYQRSLERRSGAPRFELHDGPPYSNGNIHCGTAMNKVIKDIVVRYRDLKGYRAPFRPGWDNHGMPIEHAVGREAGRPLETLDLRHRCRAYAGEWVTRQREQFQRLGVRADWDRPYLTMDHDFEADILATFAELVKRGYVYRGMRSTWWAPGLRSALADAELEYAEHTSTSIYVSFRVSVPGEVFAGHEPAYLVIWTTTPWTIPSNLAIAAHPEVEYRLVRNDGAVYLMADYLADSLANRFGWNGVEQLGTVPGAALDGVVTQHPLYDRDSPLVFADYVTVADGTGLVHTAPGHGKEDFETGRQYGLEPFCPVDEAGCYTAEVGERLAGRNVFEANDDVVAMLREAGALLAVEPYVHSYPHDWRAHEPVIVRATTQWFLNIDHPVGQTTHRELALQAVRRTRWFPAEGRERIKPMVAGRPDWCLSRQRSWGVGIPAFYCPCGAVVMNAETLDAAVAKVRELGSDAWFELPPEALLPDGYTCPECGGPGAAFTKEQDVLDVWFDSGSTHRACYADDELPVELYLEGSDQHRGWFNSSLMVGVAMTAQAPYQTVVTHGFVLDADGRAMSKSLGNVVDPMDFIHEFGADVFRLWVASVNWFEDVRISREVIERTADTYRNLRNSFRFLLGNLHDYDPAEALPLEQLDPLGRYVLHRLEWLKQRAVEWYEAYEFHRLMGAVHRFVLEVSAVYLDVAKDELYCGSPADRRPYQTVLHAVASELARLLAPVLVFTAEEVWAALPQGTRSATGSDGATGGLSASAPTDTSRTGGQAASGTELAGSVHLADWPAAVPDRLDEELAADLERLLALRDQVKLAQEQVNQGLAKADRVKPLEMHVRLALPVPEAELALAYGDTLRKLLVVSSVAVAVSETELLVEVERAQGQRCERCWRIWPDSQFGNVAGHPTVCDRCAQVVEEAGR